MCQNTEENDRLLIIFAHHDQAIPQHFLDYAKPNQLKTGLLGKKQLQKWKSRRMAFFLLTKIFEQYHLDVDILNQIKRTASGRPYLNHQNIDFNISHSGEYVAIIFRYFKADCNAVGIDIEQPIKIRQYHKLLRHYASQKEYEDLILNTALLPELTTIEQRFYLSWCLREALLKAQGVGIIKLSEVKHYPEKQQANTPYCPKGFFHFYTQLPFYLGYFFQSEQPQFPQLLEWKSGSFQSITQHQPIIYTINP